MTCAHSGDIFSDYFVELRACQEHLPTVAIILPLDVLDNEGPCQQLQTAPLPGLDDVVNLLRLSSRSTP